MRCLAAPHLLGVEMVPDDVFLARLGQGTAPSTAGFNPCPPHLVEGPLQEILPGSNTVTLPRFELGASAGCTRVPRGHTPGRAGRVGAGGCAWASGDGLSDAQGTRGSPLRHQRLAASISPLLPRDPQIPRRAVKARTPSGERGCGGMQLAWSNDENCLAVDAIMNRAPFVAEETVG